MLANFMRRLVDRLARNVQGCGALAAIAAIWHGALDAHAQSSLPCRYEITHIIQRPPCPGPNGPYYPPTVGTAISPSGRYVCGYYYSCGFTTFHAFLYDTQTSEFTTLPVAASNLTRAHDLNEQYVVGAHGNGDGFLYEIATGTVRLLPPAVPGGTCSVNGINSNNVVCGTRTIQATNDIRNAFIRWPDGTIEDLGVVSGPRSGAMDINESNAILGWTGNSLSTSNSRAFVYAKGRFTILPPVPDSSNSIPAAMNNSGTALVYGTPGATAFRWENGRFVAVPPLPGHVRTSALMLNDTGVAVGASHVSSNVSVPALWLDNSPIDLNARIEPVASIYLEYAFAITLPGSIGLNGYYAFDSVAFVAEPVRPAPGDATCDGVVNVNDLLSVINTWGPCQECQEDFNHDGVVNPADLLIVIQNWTL